jgi:predicted HicB family RNase H-like nuclease
MGGKTLKTATINVRISPELKEAAERAAAKDRRSLTSLIEKLLDDHLRAMGEPIGKPASKRK